MIGRSLGHYEVTDKLGEGGMGEVYRATDTRLGREVAIKVLPGVFTEDPERLARFEREAKLLAQLQHANIASIYGFEDYEGSRALVMELVEGPTLAERLSRGPLAIDECLSIASQIAVALEEAHDRGIVHRDLKPQNIKAPERGQVKVLDFGLAKAMDPTADQGPTSASGLAASPTLTLGATVQGMVLGTAGYMAPEQAKGQAVDKQADIWAFGVVLFEMLSGQRLFEGDSIPETLAGVLKGAVELERLPAETPQTLRRLLRRCLQRNPQNRLHDIADARIVLDEITRGEQLEEGSPASQEAVVQKGVGAAKLWWVAAGCAVFGALAGIAAAHWLLPSSTSVPDVRLLTWEDGYIHTARFGPDGTSILYGEVREGAPVAVYTTRADARGSRPLDLPGADITGIADNGEMALILDRHHVGSWLRVGTLARAALASGAPQALLEGIYDADITADGSAFAIVRADGKGQRLEYPIGTVVHRTEGWISAPRISRDGQRIAFADHPIRGDDVGYVSVLEPGKTARQLAGPLNNLQGVAWSADGSEIVASHGNLVEGWFVTTFDMSGSRRDLLRDMSNLRLQDVAQDGSLLLTIHHFSLSLEGRLADGEVSVRSSAIPGGISDDGTIVVATRETISLNGEYQSFFLRRGDGPEIDLRVGTAVGVSPDGRWAFLANIGDPTILRAVPTGPGEARIFDLGDVEAQVQDTFNTLTFTQDGETAAFLGRQPGEDFRGFVLDLAAPESLWAVTPEGVQYVNISPDGQSLVAAEVGGVLGRYSIESGERTEIPGAVADEIPVAWASTSDAIFVWDQTIPARVERVDLVTGFRSLAFEWTPKGSAEGLYGLLTASTDAEYFLMRFRGARSSIAVAR